MAGGRDTPRDLENSPDYTSMQIKAKNKTMQSGVSAVRLFLILQVLSVSGCRGLYFGGISVRRAAISGIRIRDLAFKHID